MKRGIEDLLRAERIYSALSKRHGQMERVVAKECAAMNSRLLVVREAQSSLDEFTSSFRARLDAARAEHLRTHGGNGLRFNSTAAGEAQQLLHLIANSRGSYERMISQIEGEYRLVRHRLMRCRQERRSCEVQVLRAQRLRQEQVEEWSV